jgi:uncharacterized membrane protein
MSKELPQEENNNSNKPSVVIPEEILKILERSQMPQKEKQLLLVQIATQFKGPLPHPDILRQYGIIVPNGAERIFNGFEKQTDHRIQLEDFAIKNQIKQSGRGQIFGFITAILCLGLSTALALLGHEITASIIGGTTVLGLVTIFVVGKKEQQRDVQQKKKKS